MQIKKPHATCTTRNMRDSNITAIPLEHDIYLNIPYLDKNRGLSGCHNGHRNQKRSHEPA